MVVYESNGAFHIPTTAELRPDFDYEPKKFGQRVGRVVFSWQFHRVGYPALAKERWDITLPYVIMDDDEKNLSKESAALAALDQWLQVEPGMQVLGPMIKKGNLHYERVMWHRMLATGYQSTIYIWIAMIAIVVLTHSRWMECHVRRRRMAAGLCPWCKYRVGVQNERCPECGLEADVGSAARSS